MTGLVKINQYRKNLEKFFEKEVKVPETVLRPAKVADEYSRFDWYLYYGNLFGLVTDEEFSKASLQLLGLLMGTDKTSIKFDELSEASIPYTDAKEIDEYLKGLIVSIAQKHLNKHRYLGLRYLLLFCVTVELITAEEFVEGHLALSRYECKDIDGKRI